MRNSQNQSGGCGTFVVGLLVGLVIAAAVGGGAFYYFYFYDVGQGPRFSQPAAQPGVPDINATLSETYLNKEIKSQLAGQTFKAGPIEIRNVVIKILGNANIEVNMQASYNTLAFDLTFTELVTIVEGQIKLSNVGQPKLTGSPLPLGLASVIDNANAQFIEPQINRQVTKITINNRPVKLTNVTSTTGLLSVSADVQ